MPAPAGTRQGEGQRPLLIEQMVFTGIWIPSMEDVGQARNERLLNLVHQPTSMARCPLAVQQLVAEKCSHHFFDPVGRRFSSEREAASTVSASMTIACSRDVGREPS